MEIIKKAKIPEHMVRKCKNCGCKFKASIDDTYFEKPFVGMPYKRFVNCPFCDTKIFYSYNDKNCFKNSI